MSSSVLVKTIRHRLDQSQTLDCEEQFGHLQLLIEPLGYVFRLTDEDAWALADALCNWLEAKEAEHE
jgi:hypothetical protein